MTQRSVLFPLRFSELFRASLPPQSAWKCQGERDEAAGVQERRGGEGRVGGVHSGAALR